MTDEIHILGLYGIGHEARLRALDPDVVQKIKATMKVIGLINPIIVTPRDPRTGRAYRLVAGLHRLEAARELKRDSIKAFVVDAERAELIEIIENLDRKELTTVERARLMERQKALLKDLKASGTRHELARKRTVGVRAVPDPPPEDKVNTLRQWVEQDGWPVVKETVLAVWREEHPDGRVVLNKGHGRRSS